MSDEARRSTIFATVGFLVGLAVMGLLSPHGRFWHHRRSPDKLLQRLTKDLSLTDDQRKAVRTILEDHAKKLDALHGETEAKLGALRSEFKSEMRARLTPDQQMKFDAESARWEARHRLLNLKHGG